MFVIYAYPKAGLSFFFRIIGWIPGLKREILLDRIQHRKLKKEKKSNKESVGHTLLDRSVTVSFLGNEVLKVHLEQGAETMADQFFLNRSVGDIKYLLNSCGDFIDFSSRTLIFDPGCGTGRHLFYLVDSFGCQAVGVDVYPAAIEVANKANWHNAVDFYNCSSIESGILATLIPNGCDYVFINSWINHVYKLEGYNSFISNLIKSCRFILLISSKKYDVASMMNNPQIIIHKIQGDAQYLLIKGEKK